MHTGRDYGMNAHAKMKALQIEGRSALRLGFMDIPVAGPGEIVVKTAYVGICGTDIYLHKGDSFYLENGFLSYPFVFGHEYTGTVFGIGEGVTTTIGTRVVGHCMVPCQKCDNCQRGRRNLCRNLKEVGLRYIPGAAAEYLVVPEYAVTVVPSKLSLKAATLTEPAVTAHHACDRAGIGSSDRVAIIGTGTLGLLSLMFAKLTAKSVSVIGVADPELELAKELGADRVLRPDEVAKGAYDVVIEASGVKSALSQAIDITDLGGRIALVGLPSAHSSTVDQTAVALKDLTIHGILHGIDYYGMTIDLFASGKVDPTALIARVGKVEEAAGMFSEAVTPGRRKPKFLIEFAGE
jgi:2-desacetyl-2-hydroxyethyl bacteriochlorophyllide A dehydrogenase